MPGAYIKVKYMLEGWATPAQLRDFAEQNNGMRGSETNARNVSDGGELLGVQRACAIEWWLE